MTETAIRVEGLGKCYTLRHASGGKRFRYKRLSEELTHGIAACARVLMPRRRGSGNAEPESPPSREPFWALRDIAFEVRQGEVVGIIGRNGAGKSTLLKILSRITEPTEGRVCVRGRVASLLEVGTGFHPELTGRENIYLNGTILGMTRREIEKKFDEIVAFAEIEKFLDTPVKRYSSGMYVRLAFSVAAHLEPEILLVDEVLAVGDMQFQKKCLGKMQDAAGSGRTVLFVSHNMAAIRSLTGRGIQLDGGRLAFDGPSPEAVDRYTASMRSNAPDAASDWGRGRHTAISAVRIVDEQRRPTEQYVPQDNLRVEVELETDGSPSMSLNLFLHDASRFRLGHTSLHHFHGQTLPAEPGRYRYLFDLGSIALASGSYSLDVSTEVLNLAWDHFVRLAASFDVPFSDVSGLGWDFRQTYGFGSVAMPCVEEPQAIPAGKIDHEGTGGAKDD